MKRFIICLICAGLMFCSGCSREEENADRQEERYVLQNFEKTALQTIENNGIVFEVPNTWEVSSEEKENGKSLEVSFEEGVMSIIAYRTENDFVLEDYATSYKATYAKEMISNSRKETYAEKQMEVFDFIDEVNGNKIHGTVFLFVSQEWYYTITFAVYEEVIYEQELDNIMNTLRFKDVEEDVNIGTLGGNMPSEVAEIETRYVKDTLEDNTLRLKVYVKNNSQKTFSGNVHVFFYSSSGNTRLGSDAIIVEQLVPGQESWANVWIDKYEGLPKMEVEFSEVCFDEIETSVTEVDNGMTENTKNSVRLNFDIASWYNDIKSIQVFVDGTCVVVSTSTNDNNVIANAVWSCGKDYGVTTVKVVNENNEIILVYP